MHARWGYVLSCTFDVTNGIKQGGILFPLFINVYIIDLSVPLDDGNIGSKLQGQYHLCYANGLTLIL